MKHSELHTRTYSQVESDQMVSPIHNVHNRPKQSPVVLNSRFFDLKLAGIMEDINDQYGM